MDTFRLVKAEIVKRKIPVRIAWEIREIGHWTLELEEKSSAQHFRVEAFEGDNNSVEDLLHHIEATVKQLKKRYGEF